MVSAQGHEPPLLTDKNCNSHWCAYMIPTVSCIGHNSNVVKAHERDCEEDFKIKQNQIDKMNWKHRGTAHKPPRWCEHTTDCSAAEKTAITIRPTGPAFVSNCVHVKNNDYLDPRIKISKEFACLIQLTRARSDPATFALITLGHMTSQYMNMWSLMLRILEFQGSYKPSNHLLRG